MFIEIFLNGIIQITSMKCLTVLALFFICFNVFLSLGCVENEQVTDEKMVFPEEPTYKNYQDLVVDRNYAIYPDEMSTDTTMSTISPIHLPLQKGDEITISITNITGGNNEIQMTITESNGFKTFYEQTIVNGGSYKWIVPQTDDMSFSFVSEGIDSKQFHVKIEVSYTNTTHRYWIQKYID
jgi:hypothetical protein